MSNVSICAPLIDGSLMPYINEGESCKSAVELITGDDLRPPAKSVTITVKTKSGKIVNIIIPNEANSTAIVKINNEVI